MSDIFKSKDFAYWCQKVLPLVYDKSLSYYEVLCKLTYYIQQLAQDMDGFQAQIDALGIRQDEVETKFAELQAFVSTELQNLYDIIDKIRNGEYLDLYLDAIKAYIDQNLQQFVADIVKYVSFGISDDGYFVANIPDTWDFLSFETVPWDEPLAGHLVLRW